MTICVNSQWVKWKTISDVYCRYSFVQKKQMRPSLINSCRESCSSLQLSTQLRHGKSACLLPSLFPDPQFIWSDSTNCKEMGGENWSWQTAGLVPPFWAVSQLAASASLSAWRSLLQRRLLSSFWGFSLLTGCIQLNASDLTSITLYIQAETQRDTMKRHGKKVLIQDDVTCCWSLKPSRWSTEWNAMLEVKGPWPEAENQSLSLAQPQSKELIEWRAVSRSGPAGLWCLALLLALLSLLQQVPQLGTRASQGARERQQQETLAPSTLQNIFCFWKAVEEHLLGAFLVRLF